MKALNRTKMAQDYKGKWVALKSDRKTVVASGATPKSALQSAQRKGVKSPILTHIPHSLRHFIGGAI